MKRLMIAVVVVLGISATSFAGNRVKNDDFDMKVNVSLLSRYLNLTNDQVENVASINDYLCDKMSKAAYTNEKKQPARVREAVYGNFKLMKSTLTSDQYKKYVQLMNVTLRNKGLDSYLVNE